MSSVYLERGFREFDSIIKTLVETIKDVDFIACTGISGLMFAAPVAYLLKLPLVVVRKTKDGSHAVEFVEGNPKGNYAIIDDFMSSGKSCTYIIETLEAFMCKKVYLWNSSYDSLNLPDGKYEHHYDNIEIVKL